MTRTHDSLRSAKPTRRPSRASAPEPPLDTAALTIAKRRATHWALAGIFLSMFVSMFATTVVGTSMPVIMGDLGGTQASLTWVVTGTMLASAISAPVWGKLADLTNKKLLLQLSLTVFTIGTVLAGFAHTPEWLIGWRVVQGLGGGGLAALSQIIMADIIAPRERGTYMGIGSAVMSVATVGGPLLGGLITDTVGWRWNFFVAVPITIATLVIMQLTLKLPKQRRETRIDYLGALLMAIGFSGLLLWLSLGGSQFAWNSTESFVFLGATLVVLALFVLVESRVSEPIIPLALFASRTFTLATIASLSVGIAMFTVAIYLGQFMQLAKGHTPLESGLLTIPMILGTLLSSTVAGQYVTRTGRWKGVVLIGSALTLVGVTLMGFARFETPYWFLVVAMVMLGLGVGMTMQNLVLIVQNTTDPRQIGAASAAVMFFRTLGGSAGMAIMGAVVGTQITQHLAEGFTALGDRAGGLIDQFANSTIPKLDALPVEIRLIIEQGYGEAIGTAFLVAVPFALVSLIAAIFLPNIALGTKTTSELLAEKRRTSGEQRTPDVASAAPQEGIIDERA